MKTATTITTNPGKAPPIVNHYKFSDIWNATEYRIPTTKDISLEMHSLVIENRDGPRPYGTKGTGESGLLATAPAVAGAVSETVGVVIRDLRSLGDPRHALELCRDCPVRSAIMSVDSRPSGLISTKTCPQTKMHATNCYNLNFVS